MEVAARRRAGLRLPGDLPLLGGRPAGRGLARVELGGRRGGPKWRASSPSLCLAGLASAILGTVARPPWLPALPRSFYFLFPALERLIELAGAGAGAGGGGWSSSLAGDEGGREASRARPGSGAGGRVRAAAGRAPDGNGAGWAWPPTAASLPPQPRQGYLAGLPVTSDADSQDERGRSWGRKASGDGGAQLPNPGQRRQTASFVLPPPGGEGF